MQHTNDRQRAGARASEVAEGNASMPKESRSTAVTAKNIIRLVGSPHLSLYRGEGYWYFVYDDGLVLESLSVMVPRLNHLSLDSWVREGVQFVKNVESEAPAEKPLSNKISFRRNRSR